MPFNHKFFNFDDKSTQSIQTPEEYFRLIHQKILFNLLQVLDIVRAAESFINKPHSPVDSSTPIPPKSPGGTKDLKTTTIVMSKHTLAPQTPPATNHPTNPTVSSSINFQHLLSACIIPFSSKVNRLQSLFFYFFLFWVSSFFLIVRILVSLFLIICFFSNFLRLCFVEKFVFISLLFYPF